MAVSRFVEGTTRLLELRVKNGRTWKDAVFPLENQGIVSILGVNGSGKSTIGALLEVVFFGATPKGHRRDELVQDNQESSIEVDLLKVDEMLREVKYTVKYVRSKSKSKWQWRHEIYEHTPSGLSEDKASHNAVDAGRDARVLLGWTQKEFEGSVHLTQNASHVLIKGKPAERKDYIAQFFGLDDRYDAIQDKAKKKRVALEADIARLSSLEITRITLEQELQTVNYEGLDAAQVELSQKVQSQQNFLQEQTTCNAELQTWARYTQLKQIVDSCPDAANRSTNCDTQLRSIDIKISEQEANKRHNIQAKSRKTERDLVLSQLRQLYQSQPDLDEYLHPEFDQELFSLQQKVQDRQRYAPFKTELDNLTQLLSKTAAPPSPSVLVELENEIRSGSVSNEMQRRKLTAIREGKCPTCGAAFTSTQLQSEFTDLEKADARQIELKNQLAVYTQVVQQTKRQTDLQAMLTGREYATDEETQKYNTLVQIQPGRKSLLLLNEKLRNLPEIQEKEAGDTTNLVSETYSLRQELAACQTALQAQRDLPVPPAQSTITIEALLNQVTYELLGLKESIANLQQKVGFLDGEKKRADRLRDQLKKLDQQLIQLPELKQEEFFWTTMETAYGPKGLRVRQLEKIMKLVMVRLPYYTSILFQDTEIDFGHECDAGNITIVTKRKVPVLRKKKIVEEDVTYDVSSLSGGEEKRLSIAFVLTLADCVTRNKKTNMLILDEIDSNMDTRGQNLFVNELLPRLREQYSTILVISHAEEVTQAAVFDQVWMVTIKDQWSSVQFLKAN